MGKGGDAVRSDRGRCGRHRPAHRRCVPMGELEQFQAKWNRDERWVSLRSTHPTSWRARVAVGWVERGETHRAVSGQAENALTKAHPTAHLALTVGEVSVSAARHAIPERQG